MIFKKKNSLKYIFIKDQLDTYICIEVIRTRETTCKKKKQRKKRKALWRDREGKESRRKCKKG